MISLVSPEYSLEIFCHRMLGKDLVAVRDAACAEIYYARRVHRETTKDQDFRKGSRGRIYCENLQQLISLLMNGSVPADASPEFLFTVQPLILQLLQKWEIGNLRSVFANMRQEEVGPSSELVDPLCVVVSRRDVETGDLSSTLSVLRKLTESPGTARTFFERVDIAFHGYDHISQELFEIPEVRNFVFHLDEQFPFWLFFLSKHYLGLQCLLFCFLPPFLTEEARSRIFPERIDQLLTNRWFPAMNHICEFVGFSGLQIEQLTDRVLAYITKGRLPFNEKPSV
jgi:hypothetical protein